MATPRPSEPGRPLYQAALDKLTPEMRETFVDACVVAGLSENDIAHALILSHARILDAGFTGHTKDVKTAVHQELSGLTQRLDQIQKDRVAADKKQAEALRSGIDENNTAYARLHAERDRSWQWAAASHGLTALVAVILGGLGMHYLDGSRMDEAVQKAATSATAQYAADEKALSSGAQFLAAFNRSNDPIRYETLPDNGVRITLPFGNRTLVNACANPLKAGEILIELRPVPTQASPPSPVGHARQAASR